MKKSHEAPTAPSEKVVIAHIRLEQELLIASAIEKIEERARTIARAVSASETIIAIAVNSAAATLRGRESHESALETLLVAHNAAAKTLHIAREDAKEVLEIAREAAKELLAFALAKSKSSPSVAYQVPASRKARIQKPPANQ